MRPRRRKFSLPAHATVLEEINLPPALARRLAGATVVVEVAPEEQARTRRLPKPDGWPVLIERDGVIWNDYRPLRLAFDDGEGRTWQLPRHWMVRSPERVCDPLVRPGPAAREQTSLPHAWDLFEINLPVGDAVALSGRWVVVHVTCAAAGPEVRWTDADGVAWRLPAGWRRRHIRLPSASCLLAQGVPERVARDYAGTIASVNYHAGSMCCLPSQYRFRDAAGNKWPVAVDDCEIVGFGEAPGASQ